jgi:tRNA A37 threonylcarbamoyladenosine dehydratase
MDIIEDKHTRVKMLFKEDFDLLKTSKVILFGVGGVGSFCLDCLYRSGVEDITIVDFDTYDITNQNRQIGSEAIGEIKVDRLKKLYPNVIPINQKVTPEWINDFDFSEYDLVLDAIDDIPSKIALMKKCYKKLISSMGSAKKIDPTKIEYTTLDKTNTDPLARKIRNILKKDRFNKKIRVIFSNEISKCDNKGSFVGVTASFGLAMCSKSMEHLLLKK